MSESQTTGPAETTRSGTSSPLARGGIVAIGIMFLPAGAQAALWPRSFYDDFPLGRNWIAATGGPYNEHLVRDVGALFLALALVSIWAWWRPQLCRPVACAWLLQGFLHLLFHAGHLDDLDGIDKVGILATLLLPMLLAAAVLAAERAAGDHATR